jgi:hypothetical protein
MSDAEVAWLAGIVEGEGSFICGKRTMIAVSMTDWDIVNRLPEVTGVGHVYKQSYVAKPHYKIPLTWHVRRKEHINHVTRLIYPWLGIRRRSAARVLLNVLGFTVDDLPESRFAPVPGFEPGHTA